MITYDFGDAAALEKSLMTAPFSKIGTFYRLLDHARFRSRIEWAKTLAPRLAGVKTPEEFFAIWDDEHTVETDTEYPAYPAWFLDTWCKDDQAFRRACRRLWHEKRAEIGAYENDPMDDWMLYIVPDTVITALRIGLYLSVGIAILNATGLPIDSLTLALMLVTALFTWIIEVCANCMIGVSGRAVRHTLARRRIFQALRVQRSHADQ